MFDLQAGKSVFIYLQGSKAFFGERALVTAVPERKNTQRRTKKMLHGCIACTAAVRAAATMPAGVSERRDQAR